MDTPRSDSAVSDEHGFGHHGTRAAGTGKSGERRQQMQKKDGQIAHGTILTRSRNPKNAHEYQQFAMHTPIFQIPSSAEFSHLTRSAIGTACHGRYQRSRLSTGTAEMASAGVKRKTTP